MAAVTIYSDFAAPKIESVTVSIVSLSICHEVIRPDAMINNAGEGVEKREPSCSARRNVN